MSELDKAIQSQDAASEVEGRLSVGEIELGLTHPGLAHEMFIKALDIAKSLTNAGAAMKALNGLALCDLACHNYTQALHRCAELLQV